jgi:hypothetical protein
MPTFLFCAYGIIGLANSSTDNNCSIQSPENPEALLR